MKQTSIEWLFEKLWEHQKDKLTWHSILNKAKEMHNQEMKNQFGKGQEWEHKNMVTSVAKQEISDNEIEKEISKSNMHQHKIMLLEMLVNGIENK
jgi:hypothetical protein